VLIISVDDATIGRQSARMSIELLAGGKIENRFSIRQVTYYSKTLRRQKNLASRTNEQALGVINQIVK